MASVNGIIGNEALDPETVPQAPIVEEGSDELKRMAAFAKTPEFAQIKQYWQTRIEFYQKYLPNGANVLDTDDPVKRGQMWVVANAIIGEANMFINGHEQAVEQLKDLNAGREI